jgi:hypothetical protein
MENATLQALLGKLGEEPLDGAVTWHRNRNQA